jgi:hypothetical protein
VDFSASHGSDIIGLEAKSAKQRGGKPKEQADEFDLAAPGAVREALQTTHSKKSREIIL